MKKLLIYMILLGPFLVCNVYPDKADYFVVTGLPAVIKADSIPPDSTGTFGFKLDLASLPAGSYTVTAKACNQWGCSIDSSPFVFSRGDLSKAPQGVNLSIK